MQALWHSVGEGGGRAGQGRARLEVFLSFHLELGKNLSLGSDYQNRSVRGWFYGSTEDTQRTHINTYIHM